MSSSNKWYQRLRENISTRTREKKNNTPDGFWFKCPECKKIMTIDELKENNYVCECGFHNRINSEEYFDYLFDKAEYTELFKNIKSKDALGFKDLSTYPERLDKANDKTNVNDALSVATGEINGKKWVVDCMNFQFIGGSMGSVVGEKISRSIDYCIEHKLPLLIISKSGGARMMESAYSLMQMVKTSAKLTLLSKAGLPYISLMTDPTTGGVTASYAMLGDINLAEPKALIGFAGPRVIKETIKADLPEGFQRSEFLYEKGFIDIIVDRRELREVLDQCYSLLMNKPMELEEAPNG